LKREVPESTIVISIDMTGFCGGKEKGTGTTESRFGHREGEQFDEVVAGV